MLTLEAFAVCNKLLYYGLKHKIYHGNGRAYRHTYSTTHAGLAQLVNLIGVELLVGSARYKCSVV
jgi:hypothetical protein